MPGSGNEPAELMAEREIVEPAIIKVQFTSVRHLGRVRYLNVRSGECRVFKLTASIYIERNLHTNHHQTCHHPRQAYPCDFATAERGGRLSLFMQASHSMVSRWQNLIPSFPWIVPGWTAWGRNPRKGRDQILQHIVAEP